MKKNLLLLLAFVFLSSCATLKEDPAPPAIESGYPTGEIQVNGSVFNGLKVVTIEKGKDLSSLNLRIQGYFDGSVRIDSKFCNIATTIDYKNSASILVPLSGPAKESCTVTFTVTPSYSAQNNSAIKVFGFRGHIRIKVIEEGESLIAFEKKGTENFSFPISVLVGGEGKVRVVLSGCGVDHDDQHDLVESRLSMDLGPLLKMENKETCVLEGVIVSPFYSNLYITALISKYDSRFAPLSIPFATIKNDEIELEASRVVSVVGVDGNLVFDNAISSDFSQTRPHVIRALTVKGRSVLGSYKNGVLTWMQ